MLAERERLIAAMLVILGKATGHQSTVTRADAGLLVDALLRAVDEHIEEQLK